MEFLARYGTPIGVDELLRAVEGAPLPKNAVMVTFDDGYRSCYEVVLPILRAVGMRATFFVPTGYITNRKLYWWERIAICLSQTRRPTATITFPKRIEIAAKQPGAQRTLADLIKNTPHLDIDRFLDGLYSAFEVDWNDDIERTHANNLIMSWNHVRALTRAGMDVESHSRWHRVLQTLDDRLLHDELVGSKRDLETQLGRPCRAIAYPVGRRISHLKRIRDAVIRAGYRLGLTNASGATRIWAGKVGELMPCDRFDISRCSTDRSMSDAMYFAQVALPQMAYTSRHHS